MLLQHQDQSLLCAKEAGLSNSTVMKVMNAGFANMKDGNVIDIAVSYDGTWQKHSFSSHNDIGVIRDLLTGLVIDSEVL